MSRTEGIEWQTISFTSITPGIDVLIKTRGGSEDGGDGLYPALVVLHQIREGEESGQERIVLGILNLDSGGLPIRSEVIAGVKSRLNNW
jgi:hypothetical protein